jgi:hypothetical protein
MTMEITLDESVIAAALAKGTSAAVATAVDSWELRKQLEQAAMESVARVDLVGVFRRTLDAARDRELDPIVRSVVEATLPAFREALRVGVERQLLGMVFGALRGVPSYLGEDEKKLLSEAQARLGGVVHLAAATVAASDQETF